MLSPEAEAEIQALTRRFGTPLRWTRTYTQNPLDPNGKKPQNRRGEAILVVPRPHHRVLLHTKSFYPEGIYRLPSGGIHFGEGADAAARREVFEEAGLQIALTRFLGVVENFFPTDDGDLNFPSYVFQTTPTTEPPRVIDSDERITGFRDATLAEVRAMVQLMKTVPPEWAAWGEFRATPHELVLQVLEEHSI
jgi:8-oxo-dGTP pyrophosphatase MutT (NUDIX family)